MHRRTKFVGNLAEGNREAARKRVRRGKAEGIAETEGRVPSGFDETAASGIGTTNEASRLNNHEQD